MKRVALVGAGGMGGVHASAYSQMSGAELVAVCDIREEAANSFAEKYSAQAYTDVDFMLSDIEIDVVDVCTPTSVHLEIIKKAAAAGKDVSSEKPLARNVDQAKEAISVCREAGVTLFVAHVLRWFPEFRKLRNLIADGAVGNPVEVRTSRGGGHPRVDSWFGDYEQSGGVVLDLIVHDFDWLRWCFGRVKTVYARGLYNKKVPGQDYALVTLRFESGVIGHVEGNWARPGGFTVNVEVAGTEGLLNYSNSDDVPLRVERKSDSGTQGGVIIPESPTAVNPYYMELEHFLLCLEENRQPDVRGEDGLEAVRIAEAAIKSIQTGLAVDLI